VAFTYNDPVLWAEYAIDTAAACRERGIYSVAVTAGYITAEARPAFFAAMDAVNIDLKAFTEEFYHRQCLGHLQPTLDTLEYVAHETNCWLEITTLLIPGLNDGEAEIQEMTRWIFDRLGANVPLHFTAFHPDFKMLDRPRTPSATLTRARQIALSNGLKHVYTGNVYDPQGQSTFCAGCSALLVEREGYTLGAYRIAGGACQACGAPVSGRFEDSPGSWGSRRKVLQIGSDEESVR
jgi:pyruvate formate lyase activating enzyme